MSTIDQLYILVLRVVTIPSFIGSFSGNRNIPQQLLDHGVPLSRGTRLDRHILQHALAASQ